MGLFSALFEGIAPGNTAETRMPIPLPTLNVLDAISIPTHCPVPWEEMEGTERTRFCAKCRKHVHDVSELTTDEALALLGDAGEPPCLRIYRRADGRVLTADCVTRGERVWRYLRRRSTWAASLFALLFLAGCRTYQGAMILDDLAQKSKSETGEAAKQPNAPAP